MHRKRGAPANLLGNSYRSWSNEALAGHASAAPNDRIDRKEEGVEGGRHFAEKSTVARLAGGAVASFSSNPPPDFRLHDDGKTHNRNTRASENSE